MTISGQVQQLEQIHTNSLPNLEAGIRDSRLEKHLNRLRVDCDLK